MKFQKGQSGNPAGRKPGSVSIAAAIKRRVNDNPAELESVIKALFDGAKDGSIAHINTILERVDGKVAQVNVNAELDASKLTDEQLREVARQALEGEQMAFTGGVPANVVQSGLAESGPEADDD